MVEYLIEYFFLLLCDSPHVWRIECLITFFSAVTWPCGMRRAVPPRKWNGPLSRGAGYSPETGFSTSVSKGYLNNPKSALTLLQAVSCVGPAQAWHGSLAAGLCCDTSVAPASAKAGRRREEKRTKILSCHSLQSCSSPSP